MTDARPIADTILRRLGEIPGYRAGRLRYEPTSPALVELEPLARAYLALIGGRGADLLGHRGSLWGRSRGCRGVRGPGSGRGCCGSRGADRAAVHRHAGGGWRMALAPRRMADGARAAPGGTSRPASHHRGDTADLTSTGSARRRGRWTCRMRSPICTSSRSIGVTRITL